MTNRPYAITHWATISNFIPIIGNPNGLDLSEHEYAIVTQTQDNEDSDYKNVKKESWELPIVEILHHKLKKEM